MLKSTVKSVTSEPSALLKFGGWTVFQTALSVEMEQQVESFHNSAITMAHGVRKLLFEENISKRSKNWMNCWTLDICFLNPRKLCDIFKLKSEENYEKILLWKDHYFETDIPNSIDGFSILFFIIILL